MINTVMNKTWATSAAFQQMAPFKQQLLLHFIEQTGLAIYVQWVKAGRKEELATVIAYARALMEGGVKQFLELDE